MDSSSKTNHTKVIHQQKPVLISKELAVGSQEKTVWKTWTQDLFDLADKALQTTLPEKTLPPEDIGFLTGEAPSVQKKTVEPTNIRAEEGVFVDPENVIRERLQQKLQQKTGVLLSVQNLPDIKSRPCQITYRFDTPVSFIEGGIGTFYVNGNPFTNGTYATQVTQKITVDDLVQSAPEARRTFTYQTKGDTVTFTLKSSS